MPVLAAGDPGLTKSQGFLCNSLEKRVSALPLHRQLRKPGPRHPGEGHHGGGGGWGEALAEPLPQGPARWRRTQSLEAWEALGRPGRKAASAAESTHFTIHGNPWALTSDGFLGSCLTASHRRSSHCHRGPQAGGCCANRDPSPRLHPHGPSVCLGVAAPAHCLPGFPLPADLPGPKMQPPIRPEEHPPDGIGDPPSGAPCPQPGHTAERGPRGVSSNPDSIRIHADQAAVKHFAFVFSVPQGRCFFPERLFKEETE